MRSLSNMPGTAIFRQLLHEDSGAIALLLSTNQPPTWINVESLKTVRTTYYAMLELDRTHIFPFSPASCTLPSGYPPSLHQCQRGVPNSLKSPACTTEITEKALACGGLSVISLVRETIWRWQCPPLGRRRSRDFVAALPSDRNCIISLPFCALCRTWRAQALATPRLWASLHIVAFVPIYCQRS
jgi:hypothetical protein